MRGVKTWVTPKMEMESVLKVEDLSSLQAVQIMKLMENMFLSTF